MWVEWRVKDVPTSPPQVRFSVPIADGASSNAMVALSPDGRNLAVSVTEKGKFRLRVRALDDLEARLLPGGDGARFPFWSPDGTQIGFFADGKLKTILATGGEPAMVTAAGQTILGATWVRDGVIVFSQERQLFKVNDKGGMPELLYKSDSGILFDPSSLPDGRHFLYVQSPGGVYVGSVDGAPPVRILPDVSTTVYSPAGYLLFARQSRLTAQPFDIKTLALTGASVPLTRESVVNDLLAPALSTGAGGAVVYKPESPEQLVWVDRSGAVLDRIGPAQRWRNFRLSPDQARVAFEYALTQGAKSSLEIAVLDIRRGTREQLTTDGKGGLVPVFAPDGRQIAFTSDRMGRFNPFVTSAPNQERLVRDLKLQGGYPVDWSPDGKSLLWWGNDDLWIVPVDGGTPRAVLNSRFGEPTGAFSPDGHWIAYASNESGRYEIYLTPLPVDRGRRYTVSSQGGTSPAWRRDGKELFFVNGDGWLSVVPITIRAVDVQFGRAETLFPVNSTDFNRAYEPSLDGQRFLIAAPIAGGASFTVLLNWTQTLGR
jgi:Tol biopolymer transport system component